MGLIVPAGVKGGSPVQVLLGGYILIFFARVVDVSLATVRWLLLVRGKRLQAGFIGFFEVIIYIYVLKIVVDRLTDPLSLVFYGLGFATGNVVGSLIEEKVALGLITVQVISSGDLLELTCRLRQEGFGVTTWEAEGREGPHMVLNVSLSRKDYNELLGIIDSWDRNAFITVFDARCAKGGVFHHRKAK
jgi:uncharacterized protein YebE (UPF0316 family)